MREGRLDPAPKTSSLIFSKILMIYFTVIEGEEFIDPTISFYYDIQVPCSYIFFLFFPQEFCISHLHSNSFSLEESVLF